MGGWGEGLLLQEFLVKQWEYLPPLPWLVLLIYTVLNYRKKLKAKEAPFPRAWKILFNIRSLPAQAILWFLTSQGRLQWRLVIQFLLRCSLLMITSLSWLGTFFRNVYLWSAGEETEKRGSGIPTCSVSSRAYEGCIPIDLCPMSLMLLPIPLTSMPCPLFISTTLPPKSSSRVTGGTLFSLQYLQFFLTSFNCHPASPA